MPGGGTWARWGPRGPPAPLLTWLFPPQSQLKFRGCPHPTTPFTSPSPGCRVRGWRARHSLQVRRRRHSSGERGIGEHGGPPQPSLGRHEAWLTTPARPHPSSSCTCCFLKPPRLHPTGSLTCTLSWSQHRPPDLLLPYPTWQWSHVPVTLDRNTGQYPHTLLPLQ